MASAPTDTSGATGPLEETDGTESANQALHHRFEKAMRDVYVRAKAEAHYDARLFLRMLSEYGGHATAKRLLASSTVSDGFVALWERGRIDLSVENVILRPEFESLFSEDERDIARQRLRDYGFLVE